LRADFAISQSGTTRRLVGEGQTAHARLDTQDVVVHCEHLLQIVVGVGGGGGLQPHSNLGIVNAREVASAGWLVLLWLQSEGVHVDAGVGAAGVVQVGLVLIEVLAQLLLEAILAVEHQLELVQGAHLVASGGGEAAVALLDPVGVGRHGRAAEGRVRVGEQVGSAHNVGQLHGTAGCSGQGRHGHVHVGSAGGEVPHGVQVGGCRGGGILVAPDQLLHWVVEGQTDQGRAGLAGAGDGVTAGVLHLLDQVLVTLLGEAPALLSVQVHVVGPHLHGVAAEVAGVVVGQVEVQAHLVVLQSNQWQVQAWVAVEEEQQRQVHAGSTGAGGGQGRCGGHLAVVDLVALAQEHLGVQTEPGLVVLVNALTADRQLNGCDGTLRQPAGVETAVVGGQVGRAERGWGQGHIHVADQIAVAGNRHGHAAAGASGAVHGLLDVLHGKVSVALVHRLEEGNLGLPSQVHILGAVSNELHKSTGHFVLYPKKKIWLDSYA